MSNEQTTGGALGRLAGKAKEVAGSALGKEDLAREGRLQQAGAEAEREAHEEAADARSAQAEADLQQTRDETRHERERLATEQAAVDRERAIARDRDRAETAAAARESQQDRDADAQRGAGDLAAGIKEEQALDERTEATAEAIELEQAARQAETRADAADPEDRR